MTPASILAGASLLWLLAGTLAGYAGSLSDSRRYHIREVAYTVGIFLLLVAALSTAVQ